MPYEPTDDGLSVFTDAAELRLSQSQLAQLSMVSSAILSRVLNGSRDLTYIEYRQCRDVLDACAEIQRRAAPALVDWSDLRKTREWIQQIHDERRNPPEPLSQAEALLLKKFSGGDSIDDLADDAHLTKSELLDRIGELLDRSRRLAHVAALQTVAE